MKIINAANLNYRAVNEALCNADKDCMIESCCGQRFIAAGMSDKNITINGIPGNALGSYLNNANIVVNAKKNKAIAIKYEPKPAKLGSYYRGGLTTSIIN